MIACAALCLVPFRQPDSTLWQIGRPDRSAAEFALAPNRYADYGQDPLYVVGASQSRDWPYVIPGPRDDWAGDRAHEATVAFGLRGVGPEASCRLVVDFVETQASTPPKLELIVNGRSAGTWQAPRGNGDAAIEGEPEKGRPSEWAIALPAGLLRNGNNLLTLRNAEGSWAVFDGLRLEGEGGLRLQPVRPEVAARLLPSDQAIYRTPQGPRQPVRWELTNLGPARAARLDLGGQSRSVEIKPGKQTVEIDLPPVSKARSVKLKVTSGGQTFEASGEVRPVRPWQVYLFPHSHVDVGYTDLQANVLAMHERNLLDAIAVHRESAAFPPDDQYRHNVEATWVLDRFWPQATPRQRAAVSQALREGTIGLSAAYANELTALMRPEEMMRSYRFSRIYQDLTGATLDTASQTDVPGVTWGDVTALSEAKIKYLVLMPNGIDRIGGVLRLWRDRPFWWVSPSGRERILLWETDSYALGHGIRGFNGDRSKPIRTADPTKNFVDRYVFEKLNRYAAENYPYDIVGLPWSATDNPPVDADVPYAAKAWNARYVTPHLVVSTLHRACEALVKRYGSKLPVRRGDLTPYWEDGAGSSAAETAMNRASADRLVQAETLFALRNPTAFPASDFLEAWRNVVLYSEHTWGAWNSVSDPDSDFVKAQWSVKRGFARTADALSHRLLDEAASGEGADFDVVNTQSWPRTDLVVLSAERSRGGDRVVDGSGRPLPSQRLHTGGLAVLVRNVPGFGRVRLRVVAGPAYVEGRVSATTTRLEGPDSTVVLDPRTGAVASWRSGGRELVDSKAPHALNQFLYLPGVDLKGLETNREPKFEVVEPGPLVATIRVTSAAPGARRLSQEVSMIAGLNRIDLRDTIDKLPVRDKEGVHFAFPLAVPGGQMRVDTPWAVIRPELDQLPGANKNWMCTQRFVDVSNAAMGVTCASLDAPLMEVGGITANLLGSVTNPGDWVQHLPPTQTFYSWALNNHWHTNYRASQEGRLTFRYSLLAHGPFAPDAAARFGAGVSQPLLATSAAPPTVPLLTLSDDSVLATSLRPSDDGRAFILRLWGASGKTRRVRLRWRTGAVARCTISDVSEHPGHPIGDEVEVPAWGVVTIRAERT